MAEAGRARVEKMFDRENNISALLRLYVDESRQYWRSNGGKDDCHAAQNSVHAHMGSGAAGHA